MKPRLTKSASIKIFGEKATIEVLKKVIDSNFITIDQPIIFNQDKGNWEEWLVIYEEEK